MLVQMRTSFTVRVANPLIRFITKKTRQAPRREWRFAVVAMFCSAYVRHAVQNARFSARLPCCLGVYLALPSAPEARRANGTLSSSAAAQR